MSQPATCFMVKPLKWTLPFRFLLPKKCVMIARNRRNGRNFIFEAEIGSVIDIGRCSGVRFTRLRDILFNYCVIGKGKAQ